MKFSVLIAHYNHWNYFKECYESINKQTYSNFEIVIVDDCSTDDSYQKLLELAKKDDRIVLAQNETNKKVGYTKNRCIELATGDICGFVDPDDLLSPNAIEESIKQYVDTNIVATYSKVILIDQDSKKIENFKSTRKIKNKNPLFFNIFYEVAHFFTFRKSIYQKTAGINTDLIIAEDQDLYLKMYESGNFKFINKSLYLYRVHVNGISQNKKKNDKQRQDLHDVILNACKRRSIEKLYKVPIDKINYLPIFVREKQNTLFKRIERKILNIIS